MPYNADGSRKRGFAMKYKNSSFPFKQDKPWKEMTNEERYKWLTSNPNAYDNMPGHLRRQYMDSIRKYQGSVPDSLKTKYQKDLQKHSGLKNYKKGYYGAGKSKK